MAKDFATAWKLAQQGHNTGLFAADDLYGVGRSAPKNQQYSPRTPRPPVRNPQTRYAPPRTTPVPVWSEFAGHSSQRGYTYSPTLQRQRKAYAQSLFDKLEHILSKAHQANDW